MRYGDSMVLIKSLKEKLPQPSSQKSVYIWIRKLAERGRSSLKKEETVNFRRWEKTYLKERKKAGFSKISLLLDNLSSI